MAAVTVVLVVVAVLVVVVAGLLVAFGGDHHEDEARQAFVRRMLAESQRAGDVEDARERAARWREL